MKTIVHKDERGLVSFMITFIMILVISLIVVGFTQVTNRNRREALDRQLSTQAFYAAESGANAAITQIQSKIKSNSAVMVQKNCNEGNYTLFDAGVGTGVKTTCLLVNPLVSDIQVSANTQSSMVLPLNFANVDGAAMFPTSLSLTWSLRAASIKPSVSGCPDVGGFPTTAMFDCDYALLRIDLMQDIADKSSPEKMNAATSTLYLMPVKSGGVPSASINPLGSTKATIVPAICSSVSKTCTATLIFSSVPSTSSFYARLSTLYQDTDRVTIDGAVVDSGGTNPGSAYFKNIQATIDSTGQAQDVLRRIQLRVPLQAFSNQNLPMGGIQSAGPVCKRFTAYAGFYSSECAP
ncbi:MAG: pilus assembly PilX N-terminal domain-containing protein [Candidatus Saccharimonadales bacterium]